jgi:hypothetical protein
MDLFEQLAIIRQQEDETFDEYMARVESIVQRIKEAKQVIPPASTPHERGRSDTIAHS